MEALQAEMEENEITKEHLVKEIELETSLQKILRQEEEGWRLRSCILWLKGGDQNTKLFQNQCRDRQRWNTMREHKNEDGTTIIGQAAISTEVRNFFENLYNDEEYVSQDCMEEMVRDIPALISPEESLQLESPISEEEVKKAIWSLHPDKSLGPNGFPVRFYRMCWHFIKKDLICLISWMSKGRMGGETNSTFLALIPKESNPTTIKRFRPISLCNASYKIFSKVLSLRLKTIIPSLISPNQGGFISSRHISDNILLVQKVIHSSMKKRESRMAIKLDLANAFDRLRHDFIFLVLEKFGFPPSLSNKYKPA